MITGPNVIYEDPSLGEDLTGGALKRYGGTRTTTIINKIQVYKDNVLKQMTDTPQIMYGNTLKNIRAIWVGNNEVFGTTTTTSGGIPIHYMYYYSNSWHPAQNLDSISEVKSYLPYSGSMQYGVYVDNYVPEIYFNGRKLQRWDYSGWQEVMTYKYNSFTVAIYNKTNSTQTKNFHVPDINQNINIPPYTVAFFNIGDVESFLGSESGSGSGAGSGSGSGSQLSDCYLTRDFASISASIKVTLDFTGATNYHAS